MNKKGHKSPPASFPVNDQGSLDFSDHQIDPFEEEEKGKAQVANFSDLLNTLSSVEEKTKSLWLQIYENSVQDRKNAYLMWHGLYIHVKSNPAEHAIHGQNLSRYIERMSKANDQMLKLAELVAEASETEVDEMVTDEDVYENILKSQQKQ